MALNRSESMIVLDTNQLLSTAEIYNNSQKFTDSTVAFVQERAKFSQQSLLL